MAAGPAPWSRTWLAATRLSDSSLEVLTSAWVCGAVLASATSFCSDELTSALTSALLAGVTIAAIYILGVFTGAEAPLSVWIYSAAILMLSAMTFSLYGLSFGMAFRSESAVSAAGGSLVLLAFFGNMFFPLSGWQLTIAKFTPLYGYLSLARRTLSEGNVLDGTTGELVPEPLWQVLANVSFWTVALFGVAFFLFNRERGRQ